jgi:hypothetical protein
MMAPVRRSARRAVCELGGDDQAGGGVAVDREMGRLQDHGLAQEFAPARQFLQAVGLALRRALGQRQAARDAEDLRQVEGLGQDLHLVFFGEATKRSWPR